MVVCFLMDEGQAELETLLDSITLYSGARNFFFFFF